MCFFFLYQTMHYCLKRGVMYMYTPPETCVAMQRKLRNTTLLCRSGLFSRSCTCSLSRHEHNEKPLIVLVCLIISSFV